MAGATVEPAAYDEVCDGSGGIYLGAIERLLKKFLTNPVLLIGAMLLVVLLKVLAGSGKR